MKRCDLKQLVFVYQNVSDLSIICGDIADSKDYQGVETWKHIATLNPFLALQHILRDNDDAFNSLTVGGKFPNGKKQ